MFNNQRKHVDNKACCRRVTLSLQALGRLERAPLTTHSNYLKRGKTISFLSAPLSVELRVAHALAVTTVSGYTVGRSRLEVTVK